MNAVPKFSRRRWLATAGQAALAAGWTISAPVFSQQSAGRVVVIGGGALSLHEHSPELLDHV